MAPAPAPKSHQGLPRSRPGATPGAGTATKGCAAIFRMRRPKNVDRNVATRKKEIWCHWLLLTNGQMCAVWCGLLTSYCLLISATDSASARNSAPFQRPWGRVHPASCSSSCGHPASCPPYRHPPPLRGLSVPIARLSGSVGSSPNAKGLRGQGECDPAINILILLVIKEQVVRPS